jgi:hypothetical protein
MHAPERQRLRSFPGRGEGKKPSLDSRFLLFLLPFLDILT